MISVVSLFSWFKSIGLLQNCIIVLFLVSLVKITGGFQSSTSFITAEVMIISVKSPSILFIKSGLHGKCFAPWYNSVISR